MIDSIDNIKGIAQDTKDVIEERLLSPMYFYFAISWIITNWKFVFALLFIDSDDINKEKLNYLMDFYPSYWIYPWGDWVQFGSTFWTISKLILIPALSAYIFMWWLSKLSEKFYERYEVFKQNKQTIKRKVEYTAKIKIAKAELEIRNIESDKPELRYEDKKEFNMWFNENFEENIKLGTIEYEPSEVLFKVDFEGYKNEYNEYLKREN